MTQTSHIDHIDLIFNDGRATINKYIDKWTRCFQIVLGGVPWEADLRSFMARTFVRTFWILPKKKGGRMVDRKSWAAVWSQGECLPSLTVTLRVVPSWREGSRLYIPAVISYWIHTVPERGHNFNSFPQSTLGLTSVSALLGAWIKQESPEVPVFISDLYWRYCTYNKNNCCHVLNAYISNTG